jgi:hypothetical protein
MRNIVWLICCCGIIACKPRATKLLGAALRNSIIEEKEVNKNEITVAYMPFCWQHMSDVKQLMEADTAEMVFRVGIHPRFDAKPLQITANDMHGEDPLFMLVTATDTIPASYAHKIRNEDAGGIVYLVGFDKKEIKQAAELDFIFRHQLFGNKALHFNYQRSMLEKIDSLCCSM